MTNEELIQLAEQTMQDFWTINNGKLMEHEQAAYNCLRLFCARLKKTNALLDLSKLSQDDKTCLKRVHQFLATPIASSFEELSDLQSLTFAIKKHLDSKNRKIAKAKYDLSDFKAGDKVLVIYSQRGLGNHDVTNQEALFIKSVHLSWDDDNRFEYTFLKCKKDGTPAKHSWSAGIVLKIEPFVTTQTNNNEKEKNSESES